MVVVKYITRVLGIDLRTKKRPGNLAGNIGLPADQRTTITTYESQRNNVIVYSLMSLDTHYITRIAEFWKHVDWYKDVFNKRIFQ